MFAKLKVRPPRSTRRDEVGHPVGTVTRHWKRVMAGSSQRDRVIAAWCPTRNCLSWLTTPTSWWWPA